MREWRHYTGDLVIDDQSPLYFGPLSHLRAGMLTFLEDPARPGELFETSDAIVLCYDRDAEIIQHAGHSPHVVKDVTPRQTFWRLFKRAAQSLSFEAQAEIDRISIHYTSYVQPGAQVGGAPFKVIELDGRRQIAPHVGGVSIGARASIGSHACIDSGIYGESTEIHDEAFVDNLVHVGHSTVIRARARVVAGAVLGGWSDIGQDAWIGIGALVRDHVTVGDGAVVGMGAVVVKDVPPGVTVVGNPARKMKK